MRLSLAILALALLAACRFGPTWERRHSTPRWFYIGWSCATESPYTGTGPICPPGNPRNILYSGFSLLTRSNPDGTCGRGHDATSSLDVLLTWGITDTTYVAAAACILRGSRRFGIYRCAYEGRACHCVYFYEFESRAHFQNLARLCRRKHPGRHP